MSEMIKPTWATSPTPQGKIYVAGNGAGKILEIDLEDWEITRRFATPAGPYNLDVSLDGMLLAVTYKSSRSVGFWDLNAGKEVGRVETLRPIPHGIVITPDARYAFATIEGIGTLNHMVVAEEGVPDDLSGAQLPPTASYRDR